MTSLIEGADKLVTRGTELGVRVKGLDAVVNAARGRLDDTVIEPASEVVTRAGERLRLSADHTVIALGGATGSGKSSTFNALVGLELASVSVRRPTTSWATACTWGSQGASELLEWLGIPTRHQVVRDSMLDTGREAKDMDGLVLLDMPDHDSTEVAHHLEVDRLVRLADLLIWVLDPQKYADAAIHDRFLQPFAAHRGVMMIVLNHIDEVAEDRRAGMIADLRRLLDNDGLEGITLIATSASEGIGIEDLRAAIIQRVADKAATRARISTNLTEVAHAISAISGTAAAPELVERERAEFSATLAGAAGVPVVVEAIEKATLAKSRRATGWPWTSWTSRFAEDPLAQLDLDASGREFVARAKATLPKADQIQTAQVDNAVRDLSDRLAADLTRPWATSVRRAATAQLPELSARLDRAISTADLGSSRGPAWVQAVRAVQWLLVLVVLGGAAWLVGRAAHVGGLSDVKVAGVAAGALMVAGGLALGLLIALISSSMVTKAASARARTADARLREAVDLVVGELVLAPLGAELEAYRTTQEGLRAALG